MKYLHIGSANKFTVPFFTFLRANFCISDHKLLFWQKQVELPTELSESFDQSVGFKYIKSFLCYAKKAEKIFIHSLFDTRIIVMLACQPWILKKCYWLIWGGDLYARQIKESGFFYKLREWLKLFIIPRIGNLVTYIPGDIDNARAWYRAKGKARHCILYQSNVFKGDQSGLDHHAGCNVMVGNSADPSNNHMAVLATIREQFIEGNLPKDFKIFIPLSYGDEKYRREVISYTDRNFSGHARCMTEFMSIDEYLKFLNDIDFAIFYHDRQQGMGNIINLIGLGKKVFIKIAVTPWAYFQDIGVEIFDADKLEFSKISDETRINNFSAIKLHFSEEKLVAQWKGILE